MALATTASASWLIGGTQLAEGSKETLASTKDGERVLLKIAGSEQVRIACKGTAVGGGLLLGLAKGTLSSLTFEGCETVEPSSKCALEGQPVNIVTEPLEMLASEGAASSEGEISLVPKVNTLVATLPFNSTNTCAHDKHETLSGAVGVGASTLGREELLQGFDGIGSLNNALGLEVGGHAVLLEGGQTLLKLTSGGKFANLAAFRVVPSRRTLRVAEAAEFTITNISGKSAKVSRIIRTGQQFEYSNADLAICTGEYSAGSSCKVRVLRKLNGVGVEEAEFIVEDQNGRVSGATIVGT